jgi:alkaline phosphatase D
MRVYDRFSFGDLLDVSMIDGRQYRSREACYAPPDKGRGHLETDALCPERREEGRTMMGFAQEAWLATGLARSKAQWNLIAQDVLMAQLRQKNPNGNFAYWTDDWDGYPAGRRRLLARIAQTKVSNPVVIGGDIHAFFANDLRIRRWSPPNSSAPPSPRRGRPTTCSRRRCPTILMSASSRAASAAMSASISTPS